MTKPIVIVRVVNGCFEGIDFAGDVDVFCYDPECHSEPLYLMTLASDPGALRRLVGDGPWPNAYDDRHAAIVARFEEEHGDGKPRLRVVAPTEPADSPSCPR